MIKSELEESSTSECELRLPGDFVYGAAVYTGEYSPYTSSDILFHFRRHISFIYK